MRFSSALFAASALVAAPALAEPTVELSTGLEYQEGEYGTGESIETWTVPTTVSVRSGQVVFSATLPYLRVEAPGNVIGGGGGILGLPIIVDPTEPPDRVRREGVGDLELGATYTVPSQEVGLTLSGQMKVPTASAAKGLGTGEMDVAVGAELSKTLGRVTPFVGVGYTMPGDPEAFELQDSLSARAGAAVQMGDKVRGHVAYGYAQSVSPLVPDEQQVSAGLNAGLSQRLTLGVYGSAGLSEGSPDMGGGVRLGTIF